MNKYFFIFVVVFLYYNINIIKASEGDRSLFFQNCLKSCNSNNCTKDGENYRDKRKLDYTYVILRWSCFEECKYECMWRTTRNYMSRKWNVPQFYGKWPFKRIFGIQEPASVLFSIMNLLVHCFMITKLRITVRNDTPLFWMWHVFAGVCINGWLWSTVFHIRDFPITELFDYGFAYSMIVVSLYCLIIRSLYKKSNLIKLGISIVCLIFFLNHFAYLSVGSFDYKFNMRANIVTGIISGIGWMSWCLLNRKQLPYAWKMITFQILAAITLLLEIIDFPPILWIFDAHSLWHLSTVPITILFYSFAIDDCIYLRQEQYLQLDQDKDKNF